LHGWAGRVVKYGGSGVGTEGNGSSIKGTVMKPGAIDNMMAERVEGTPLRGRDGQTLW